MEPLFRQERGERGLLSDVLMPLLKPVESLADEDLVEDPSATRSSIELTREIDAIVAQLADDDRSKREDGRARLSAPQRTTLSERIPRLQRQLECARERESRSMARSRPEGCWCLGLGGRGSMFRTPGEPINPELRQWESKLDEAAWNIAATGRAVERAAVYCDCPEGLARREREAQRRLDWLSGFTAGQETERLQQRWSVSGLPPLDEIYSLDQYPQTTPDQKRTMRALAQWKPPRGLMLTGHMRLGKTTIAMGLGLKALKLGYGVRFWTVDGLIEHLKAGIGRQEAQEDLIRFEAAFEFLILDDIGTGPLTEFSARSLLALIDQRLQAQRPTIFTSNHPLQGDGQLSDALAGKDTGNIAVTAERIVARIKQHVDVVEVKGAPLGQPAKVREPLRWD